MKIGVTGASGHLGLVVVKQLLERGYEVKALINRNKKGLEDLPVEMVKGSILEQDALESFTEGCDVVIHCAAIISMYSDKDGKIAKTNIKGVRNVMEACLSKKVKRVIHVSSIHVYRGEPTDVPLDETREFVQDKRLAYDCSKRDGHQLALSYQEKGLDVLVVNPTGLVGPPDFGPSLMGQAIFEIYYKKIPALVKGGFDFMDIRDGATAIVNAIKQGTPGENYLLAGKWISVKQIKEHVEIVKNKKINLPVLPVWLAYIGVPFIRFYAVVTGTPPLYTSYSIHTLVHGNKHISSAKAEKELGYNCRPFSETVSDLINWHENEKNVHTS